MRGYRTAAAAALAMGVIAGACSGSSKQAATPTRSAASPAASAVPTLSAADLTAAAPNSTLTIDYKDPAGRFTVQLPSGWRLQPDATGVSTDVTVPVASTAPGAPPVAIVNMSIACQPGATVTDLIAQDQRVLQNANAGRIDLSTGTAVDVAGVSGTEVEWSGSNVIPLSHVSVYFEGHGCAWRIMLTAFPGADIEQYRPILDRTLRSFRFAG